MTDAIVGIILTAIFSIAGVSAYSYWHPGEFRAVQNDASELLSLTRDQSRSYGGATLYIANGANGWTGTVYPGRPIAGGHLGPMIKRVTHAGTLTITGMNATYAIVMSSAGAASVDNWDGSATLTTDAGCPAAGIQMTATVDTKVKALSFPCM